MHHLRVIIPTAVLYLMLSGNWEWRNLLFAALIGVLTTILLRPEPRAASRRDLPAAILAALRYVAVLLLDLVKSGFQVAWIVVHPKMPIRPGMIRIPAGSKSDLARALSAHSITLTPGEMVVEMTADGDMFTHVLDVAEADRYVLDAQRRRDQMLGKIFE